MKKCALVIICFAMFTGNVLEAKDRAETNERFNAYKERFVLALWQLYPSWAASVGFHKYDQALPVPDNNERKKELDFNRANLDSLKEFNVEELSDANKTDFHLIENQLKYAIWCINDLRSYEWDPSGYNVSGSFSDMLVNDYDALDTRLHDFYVKMSQVPAYYEAAKANIRNPTREHTSLAIEQNLGGISVFEKDLDGALKQSKLSDQEKTDMKVRAAQTIAAIKDYTTWLKNLYNDHPRSFRLGKELYEKKFEYEIQSRYKAHEIYEKAVAHKAELLEKMYDLTRELWPRYFAGTPMPGDNLKAIRQMIGRLSRNQVLPDSFQSAIEHQLPRLIAFVGKKDLIYIDPAKPLVVRREPDYMGGVAGASISAPGPYDKNGKTWYNVGSLDGWDPDRKESYLREYNHYTLQILNIHEAIPGHYTQLVYANQSPSIIKSILGNNAMIEGWAVYAERMMLENGYDGDRGPDSREASPEMWLMYYKWNLRSTCNTILDYSVHTLDMSKKDAMNLLENEAFQERAEAEGKWKRVSVTQVQLDCYFTGYTEIYDFHKELMDKMKDKFNLKKFHEKFLSYGSAPVKYIREMMLDEMKK